MFDKLQNIKITINKGEPRIEFEVYDGNNNGVEQVRKYDVCLSLVPSTSSSNENVEKLLEKILVDIFNYAETCHK